MSHVIGEQDVLCPSRVRTAREFAQLLTAVRERAGLSVREAAATAGLPSASAGGYFAGRHLPPVNRPEVLAALLGACGVHDEEDVTPWLEALRRVRRARGRAAEPSARVTVRTGTVTDSHARSIAGANGSNQPAAVALDAHPPHDFHDAVWLAVDAAMASLEEAAPKAAEHLLLRLDLLERLGRLEGQTLRWEDLPGHLSHHLSIVSPFVAAGLLTADGVGVTLTRPLRHQRAPLPAWVSADPDAAPSLRRLIDHVAN